MLTLVVSLILGLTCCALTKKLLPARPLVGPAFSFRVKAEALANLDSPVAVDLVLVQDRKLLARVAELPSATWFAEREQFQRDLLGSPHIRIKSWEWAPGQSVDQPIHVQYPAKGWAAILFARYRTPGQHRVRVDPIRQFTLRLGKETLSVEEIK